MLFGCIYSSHIFNITTRWKVIFISSSHTYHMEEPSRNSGIVAESSQICFQTVLTDFNTFEEITTEVLKGKTETQGCCKHSLVRTGRIGSNIVFCFPHTFEFSCSSLSQNRQFSLISGYLSSTLTGVLYEMYQMAKQLHHLSVLVLYFG